MAGKTSLRKKGGGKKSIVEKPKKTKAKKKKKKAIEYADTALFAALTEGERADALRILTEDKRLASMAKVGRYRVVAIEPFPTKPPSPLAGKRIIRLVAYDYASDKCVEATIDLDGSEVASLTLSRAQPMLSIDEEDAAVSVAVEAAEVKEKLGLGEVPLGAMHYWSWRDTDLAFSRRSAAVLFGQPGGRPSWVAVVDLLDHRVAELVPGEHW